MGLHSVVSEYLQQDMQRVGIAFFLILVPTWTASFATAAKIKLNKNKL